MWCHRRIVQNLYIFPLISSNDIVIIKWLTVILKIIGQCDIKHIMSLPTKRIIMPVLKVSTYITISIIARSLELVAILAVMSILNFITAIILHLSQQYFLWGGGKLYLIRLYQVHLDTGWEWNLTGDKILTPLSTSLVILYE